MKEVLIVGGTGYIGSALYSYLSENFVVHTVDLEWFGNYTNENNLKINYSALSEDFFGHYDVIILLAGNSSVPMCLNNMADTFKNNLVNFVDLLGKLKNQKFIYASSSSIYGDTGEVPAPEDWDQFKPKNYYDLTKQEIDYYAELSKLEYYGLRFGTVNGPSPNLRVDIMINKMYHIAKTMGRIDLFNSHISRPILGMNDLCRAIEAIIKSDTDNRGVYNLASFNGNVGGIVEGVTKCVETEVIDRGNTPAYNFSIDTSKFQNTFGFEFEESIETIVASLDKEYNNCRKSVRERRF